MRKKILAVCMITGMMLVNTACGQNTQAETSLPMESTTETTTEAETTTETETEVPEVSEEGATLKLLSELLGLTDEDSESLFGGGTENRSGDNTILIGRDYQTQLFDRPAAIHTMYDENDTIYVVQAEIEGMSILDCQEEISKATETQMLEVDKGESGQQNGQWSYDGKQVNLYQTEGTLFIELFVPVE